MLLADSFGLAVVERLADLFAIATPWTQRQWRSGTLDALRHLQALTTNGGRDSSKGWALSHLRHSIESDPFIPALERAALLKPLAMKPDRLMPAAHGAKMLDQIERHLVENYWTWAAEVCTQIDDSREVADVRESADTFAWRLAAHFRSSGLSDGWIVNFANYQRKFEKDARSLAQVVMSAHRSALGGSGWVFLIPLQSRRGFNIPSNETFLTPNDFEAEFASQFPGLDIPAHRGGLRLIDNSIDKYAAVEGVRRALWALQERLAASGAKRSLVPTPTAWVNPGGWTTDLGSEPSARFRFPQVDADGGASLFNPLSDELEASIDLLLSANTASARSAVVSSWSALETLFADDGDYGELSVVADRAAAILTCVYVRDAFESLAIGHSRNSLDELARNLRAAGVSDRAVMVSEAIEQGQLLAVNKVLGAVAVKRAAEMTSATIEVARSQISNCLRRLYDVRNQVVHAGAIEPYGLRVTLASSSALLTAVVNEAISFRRATGGDARQLAARARWLLTSVSERTSAPCSLASL